MDAARRRGARCAPQDLVRKGRPRPAFKNICGWLLSYDWVEVWAGCTAGWVEPMPEVFYTGGAALPFLCAKFVKKKVVASGVSHKPRNAATKVFVRRLRVI